MYRSETGARSAAKSCEFIPNVYPDKDIHREDALATLTVDPLMLTADPP